MRWVYTFVILVYKKLIFLFSLFDKKANQKYWGSVLWKKNLNKYRDTRLPLVWFHVSSLGEFEQGRPVIEQYRNQNPKVEILITFFSPSGFNIRHSYSVADYVTYLPFDIPGEVELFVDFFQPSAVAFVKYDYWYNLLHTLDKRDIPTLFFCSKFREKQLFFQPYGKWFLKHLQRVNYFFVQDENSRNLLNSFQIKSEQVADTRLDRVREIALQNKRIEAIEQFKGDSLLFVMGSYWPDDFPLLEYLSKKHLKLKILIAPHEVGERQLNLLSSKLKQKSVRLKTTQSYTGVQFMILDTIGILSVAYQYADVVYIGGGFGKGIHNTLEPAAFGNPIFFGPRHQKFDEAVELINIGAAKTHHDKITLAKEISDVLNSESLRAEMAKKSKNYVFSKPSSVMKITDRLEYFLR